MDKPNLQITKNLRFLDAQREPGKILQPIEGFQDYPLVPLEQATQPLEPFLADIKRRVWVAKENTNGDKLTRDEAASIYLYTMEWEPLNECLYYLLNSTLRTENRQKLVPFFSYLKLIFTALDKLESKKGVFYRGVKLDLSDKYEVDKRYVWWGFTSCTESLSVLQSDQFLGQSGPRTLFNIECSNGKSIQHYSYIPNESEVLIRPATQFIVRSKFSPAPDLHIIHLQETEPPFPLLQWSTSLTSISANSHSGLIQPDNSNGTHNVTKPQLSDVIATSSIRTPSLADNNTPPNTWAPFFELGLEVISPKDASAIIKVNGVAYTEILIRTPLDVELLGRLENNKKEKIRGGHRVYFDRHKGLWRCLFAPDRDGMFEADILAKRKSEGNTYPCACSFKIEAKRIPSPPLSYPKTWQIFYDLDLELEVPYNRGIIDWPPTASYVEIRIRAPDNVQLSCDIKYNDAKVERGGLAQFHSGDHNWQLFFAPQHTGLHELLVYAKRVTDASTTSHAAVKFFLNVTQLRETIKFPITYSKFHTTKCRIIEPIRGTLRQGSEVLFHCLIPGAMAADLIVDSKWMGDTKYQDPELRNKIKVGSNEVSIYAKYGQKSSYDGLLKYTVE